MEEYLRSTVYTSRLYILRRCVTDLIGLFASGRRVPRLISPDKAITDIFLEFL